MSFIIARCEIKSRYTSNEAPDCCPWLPSETGRFFQRHVLVDGPIWSQRRQNESGNPFTNRQHNACERRAGEEQLHALIELLRPARIIAIGNDAAVSASRVADTVPVFCVRHPSYGGQAQFLRQIADLYKVPPHTKRLL